MGKKWYESLATQAIIGVPRERGLAVPPHHTQTVESFSEERILGEDG